MSDNNTLTIRSDSGCITTTNAGDYPYYYEYTTPYYEMPQNPVAIAPYVYPTPLYQNKKGGDDNMRYLYEVILVNPKNDEFQTTKVVARSETSALMEAFNKSDFSEGPVNFDDLKTSCRVLMEWKKEKSLKKAIETIKEAVE